jgi:hypothetical protein
VSLLAVHAHFYQPPREDPATGEIPREHGAEPFANWNERIAAECYRPNAERRNFERLSFDLGPTLGAWLARREPRVLEQIAEADRANVARYGAGNAMAQAYHHTILPLATRAEKELEVAWGIAEFEHRFGRRPRGLWCPETAADAETLEVAAEHGIEFTILAPWQARGRRLDPSEPYWIALPSGRRLAAFFFLHPLAGRMSFDPKVTRSADDFARDLLAPARPRERRRDPFERLVLLASDGELYGHHQEFRDHFLAQLLRASAAGQGFGITYPELWLAHHRPRRRRALAEVGSWSCHHGVARWSEGCACTKGDSSWKRPLRQALATLAEELDRAFAGALAPHFPAPRRLLLRYVEVLLGRLALAELAPEVAGRPLFPGELRRVALLLEAQRLRHQMFASCGWFPGEFGGLESRNNLAFAAAAVVLTRLATGIDLAGPSAAALSGVANGRTGERGDRLFAEALARFERAGPAVAEALALGRPRREAATPAAEVPAEAHG